MKTAITKLFLFKNVEPEKSLNIHKSSISSSKNGIAYTCELTTNNRNVRLNINISQLWSNPDSNPDRMNAV